MPQLRQQCADVGSRMKMQQVYAQQCVQSLGWQIWNLEWSVLPCQLRLFLDSNSRAMRIWIQQTFIWPFLNLTSQFVKGPLLATQGPFWWKYFWSLKWCTDILMTIYDNLNTLMLEPGWSLPLLLAHFGHGSGQVRHTKGWPCRIPGIKNNSHAANVRIFDLDLEWKGFFGTLSHISKNFGKF